jgi:uncharacterized protein
LRYDSIVLAVFVCVAVAGCHSPSKQSATKDADDQKAAAANAEATESTSSSSSFNFLSPASSAKKSPPSPDLYDKLLFYPTQFPAGDWQPRGLNFEDVAFTASDGTKLHGWFCPCEPPKAVVLYAHGNGGNLSFDASLLRLLQQQLRVAVFAFDYRGYGKSEGVPTIEGALDDARSARAWLAQRAKVKESDVVLMGRSLGGAVVVQLAADSQPRGLVLESTFSSLKEVAGHHFPRLAWLVPKDELNSTTKLATYDGPLLHSHGDADETIPFAQGEKLFAAAQGRKDFVRIPGGNHNDPLPSDYYQRLDRFFAELP